MLITVNGKRTAVYSVVATSETEAQTAIETELANKPHRRSILQRWIDEGKPVRVIRPRVRS